MSTPSTFDVDGVQMRQPFRIRRLGHFGVNVFDPEQSLDFYNRLLGFEISDRIDFAARLPPEVVASVGPTQGIFMRHGTDHHSFVLFPQRAVHQANPHYGHHPELTVNQITWQVSTLREVVEGYQWFKEQQLQVLRSGRDLPGSNWHFYPPDPSGHINELYYGIEQIGWNGHSKSALTHEVKHMQPPELPQPSEFAEINRVLGSGLEQIMGWRRSPVWPETYDVGGVLLARPFKVTRVGPIRLFVDDMAQALHFYQHALGLRVTEEVMVESHRCVFLRANTEHHSLALYPKALRADLGLPAHSSLMSCGIQLGSYQQLVDAHQFLTQQGVSWKVLPAELSPGIGHHVYATDPDGNLLQLYAAMEQIGWDGRPCPAHLRAAPPVDPAQWPASLTEDQAGYDGEVFLGPLN
ncbi:hypothetical protein B9Z39_02135 [Limnohabitans sp. JirII-29]|uniref:VOC family protein n=1 Tax=Limnohabitans sp. JirII-29 TaxID=1835756 RepID=UPI000D3B9EEC|nr:VOC family protein [Limnohabitans sp. JirII-29]PUE30335.1 hypothetical protein B9Z39_02135 [Limnohabitans sp. JirII-29]